MSNTRLRLEILLAAIDKATAPIKQLMGSSRKLADETKALRDKQKELQRVQNNIDSYRKTSAQAGATAAALKRTQETIQKLAQEISATTNPTREMKREFEKAKQAAKDLKTQHGELIEKQRRMRERLRESGVETKNLLQHQRRLRDELASTNTALTAQEKKLEALNKQQQKKHAARADYQKGMAQRDRVAGFGASAMAAGAATGMAVLAPVKAFAEAEDSAVQLKVAMMQAGGKVQAEYAPVVALAEKLGSTLPGTTAEFQDMMRILIQKGLDAKTVLGGAGEATAKLAILTKSSFADTADAISVLQDSMGVADKDMVAAADQMQRLYNVGMKIPDIQEGFKAIGPALTYIGKGGLDAVKALAPLLAITDAAGINASTAGIAYNSIIRHSLDQKKVSETNGLLKGTGIKLKFTDDKGNFAGIENLVSQVMKLKDLSHTQRSSVISKLFGNDAQTMDVLNALMKAGNEGIAQMSQKLANQASLQERIGAQLGTLKNLWDAAGGAFTGLLVKLGESIAPAVKSATQAISAISDWMSKWAAENPGLSGTLMTIAAIVAVVAVVLGGMSLALATIMGPMLVANMGLTMLSTTVLPALTAATAAFGAVLMATPVGWIVAGIAAIIVVGNALYAYWEPIKAFLGGMWEGFTAGLRGSTPLLDSIGALINNVITVVQNLLGPLGASSESLGTAASAGAAFGTALALAAEVALLPFKLLLATLSGIGAALAELSAGNLGNAWSAAKSAFGAVFEKQSALTEDTSDVARMAAKTPVPPAGAQAAVAKTPDTPAGATQAADKTKQPTPKPPATPAAATASAAKAPATPPVAGQAAGKLPGETQTLAGRMPTPTPAPASGQQPGLPAPNQPIAAKQQNPLMARPAGGAQPAGQGVSQSITINVTPTPGMNEQALAKLVAAQVKIAMAQAQTQQTAAPAKRAALYDRE